MIHNDWSLELLRDATNLSKQSRALHWSFGHAPRNGLGESWKFFPGDVKCGHGRLALKRPEMWRVIIALRLRVGWGWWAPMGWWFQFTLQFLTCHWHYLDVFLLATLNPRQSSKGHARVTAAWAFSPSWMMLVENIHMYRVLQSTLFFAALHWSWLRNEAAHRFYLDTLQRERVLSLSTVAKCGLNVQSSWAGHGIQPCRVRESCLPRQIRWRQQCWATWFNDSRSLSLAWPSMPFCNHCAMLPHWAFQMFSSWCFPILLYKRMQAILAEDLREKKTSLELEHRNTKQSELLKRYYEVFTEQSLEDCQQRCAAWLHWVCETGLLYNLFASLFIQSTLSPATCSVGVESCHPGFHAAMARRWARQMLACLCTASICKQRIYKVY